MSKNPRHNKTTSPLKQYARYSGLAFQMLAAIFLGIWVGMKIDQWLGIAFPAFTLTLCLLALVGSIYYLAKSLTNKQ